MARRFIAWGRSWLGIVAIAVAVASSAWLIGEYLYARYITPIEKATIAALKEQSRTDTSVAGAITREFDVQHVRIARRRVAYQIGGLTALIAVGVVFAWFRWLRPGHGEWVGVPEALANALARPRDQPALMTPPPRSKPAGDAATAGPLITLPALPASSPDVFDPAVVDTILEATGRSRDAVLPVLQAIQARYRFLPEAALRRVHEASAMGAAQLAGVASFYGQFRLTPTGRHVIRVCEGTACHVSGAVDVRHEIRRCLGMPDGVDTDPTRTFTIERVACVGSCSLAPVVTIDEQIYGHLTALSVAGTLGDFLARAEQTDRNGHGGFGRLPRLAAPAALAARAGAAAPIEIRIGLGTCGRASGAADVHAALEDSLASFGGGATLKAVGCSGLCHHEPLVEVVTGDRRVWYGNLTAADARKVLREHVRPSGFGRAVRETLRDSRARLVDDDAWVPIETRRVDPVPYVGKQVRVVLENSGEIDPLSFDDYRARGGMQALERCLTMTPKAVIDEVRASGLRGRGGAGFATATKWDLTRRAAGPTKYVICNGDEGDPGAFMDRAVLESDPFRVVEGLAMAGYAVGAAEGIIYVRSEYPIAVRHARAAIAAAEARGFLGERVAGTPFSFRVQVREGAGAFVCGEETALIHSIEGERGMPRLRPPYPAESGLWGRPTLINNVETLACLPWIFRHGPERFATMGTPASKGTKVFSLTGKVKRTGLIEVPMGITIREIVDDIGGGMLEGRTFKAVLAGGPSGGIIPASLADTPVDFETLSATGAIMGSGGLVVLDNRDCAVDIARYFLHFTQSESCGKCTFCRIGTKRMLEILERICDGRGVEADLAALDALSVGVKTGSLCGLGQTAPNPVLTTLRYFRDEYVAHIRERRCPAASCKALIRFRVLDNCTGCTLCAQACPAGAIVATPYQKHHVADDLCTRCGMCVTACPEPAIEVV